jgi:hypothetical protein
VHKLSNISVVPSDYGTDWLDIDNASGGDNVSFNEPQTVGNIASSCKAIDVAGVVGRGEWLSKLDDSLTCDTVTVREIEEGDVTNYQFICTSDSCNDYEVKYFFTDLAGVNE